MKSFVKTINLDKEQSIKIKSGDVVFHIYKEYKDYSKRGRALKRHYERKKARGLCTYPGCSNRVMKDHLKCEEHVKMDREKNKLRMREYRKKKKSVFGFFGR